MPNVTASAPGGAVNTIPKFTTTPTGYVIGNSAITEVGGRVGIGTTTPGQALDVVGTVQATGIKLAPGAANGFVLTSDASGIGTWKPGGVGGGGTANAVPKFTAAATLGNSAIYESGGNVGIGTSTPASGQKLDVVGNIQASGNIQTSNALISQSVTSRSSDPTVTAGVLDCATGGKILSGRAAGVEKFSVDARGNVLVGVGGSVGIGMTTVATEALDVAGTVQMSGLKLPSGAVNGYVLTSDASGVAAWQPLPGGTGSPNTLAAAGGTPAEAVYVDGNGRVGIGIEPTTSGRMPQETLTLAPGANSVIEMRTPDGVGVVFIGGGLTPGDYYFRVTATDGVGWTKASQEQYVPLPAGQHGFRISWNPVLGATRYRVYRFLPSTGQYQYDETPIAAYDYVSDSQFANTGPPPEQTTAYMSRLAAAGANWINGGNVGIGTTNPAVALHVRGGSGEGLRLHSTGASGEGMDLAWFSDYGGAKVTAVLDSDASGTQGGNLTFRVRDQASNTLVDRMAIDNAGQLHVTGNGALSIEGTPGAGARVYHYNNGSPEWAQGTQNGAPSQDFNLFNYGLYGVALSVSRETNRLTAYAGVTAPAFTTSSSRRWKRNIQTIEGALSLIKRLRGISYDQKEDDKHTIGLIAEEVGEVIPAIVTYEENGQDARGLDYSRLVAVLIEAVKEQQGQIEGLQATVRSLSLHEGRAAL